MRRSLVGNTNALGYLTPRLAPTEKATSNDIRWAAGFYEGDGGCCKDGVYLGQKDPEMLYRLRALFGGNVWEAEGRAPIWCLTGARGRGFMMSIYGLLSVRRQKQIRKCMAIGEFRIALQKGG